MQSRSERMAIKIKSTADWAVEERISDEILEMLKTYNLNLWMMEEILKNVSQKLHLNSYLKV